MDDIGYAYDPETEETQQVTAPSRRDLGDLPVNLITDPPNFARNSLI
jgi:hypothetical protein